MLYTYGKSHRCIQLAENFLLELREKKNVYKKKNNKKNGK